MACPLCADKNAQQSVHRLAQNLQSLAGRVLLSADAPDLSAIFDGIALQHTKVGDLVVRGLVYEWLMKAGLRYQIEIRDRPTPHYELVPAHTAELGRFGRSARQGVAQRAWAFINERHADQLTNLNIAGYMGCSRSYLARAFRRAYNMTPGQHLRNVRTLAGVNLLEMSDVTVEAISRQVGFKGKANFYAAVRSATSKTPGEIRGTRRARRAHGHPES